MGGHVLADRRQFGQVLALLDHLPDRVGALLDRVDGVAVGPDAEWIGLALDLQKGGHLFENRSNLDVLHAYPSPPEASSSSRKPASSRTVTPSAVALSNFDPGSAPATT